MRTGHSHRHADAKHPYDHARTETAATFWITLLTLIAKDILLRYLMAVAKCVRSQLLAVNAWHSRSDTTPSLVVLVGIGGNLLGFTFLDSIAAAVVGVMIAHMGGKLALQALVDLIDTGLDAEEVVKIRKTQLDTRGLHELRTRLVRQQLPRAQFWCKYFRAELQAYGTMPLGCT